MERVADRSIRIKINNDCQWTCTFCHNEGTELPDSRNAEFRVSAFLDPAVAAYPHVEDIVVNPSTITQIASLQRYGISETHLTGGEPTLHPQLPQLVTGLAEAGFEVKLTTNGQASPSRFSRIAAAGLKEVTFSVLSFDPAEFLRTQNPPRLPGVEPQTWAQAMIDHERANILLAKSLGVGVKINTAVLGPQDYPRVDTVRQFAQEHDLTVVLLNSLGDGEEAIQTVFNYAQIHGTYVRTKEHTNNAKGAYIYSLAGGGTLRAKYLRDYHPEVVCGGCEHRGKPSCWEKFYGLRMEFRGGQPFIRLCLQKTNARTLMPLDQFLAAGIIDQL